MSDFDNPFAVGIAELKNIIYCRGAINISGNLCQVQNMVVGLPANSFILGREVRWQSG